MISFMVPTKPDWSGLVLSTQNLSCNSEFVHLPSWYRPLHCWFVCLFVKCILEFSDMHIQVMSNNVCQELHFNFFKILMFYTVVNIQVVMVMFKLSQRNLA